jgi:mannose-1-phosphate guanylyltransferase
VIISGGRGERFWPRSRLARPKQLLPIVGDKPMLAQTLDRVEGLIPPENIFIITNEEQREACIEVAPQVPEGQIVGEPMGRDTAPAVALAALLVQRKDPEATFAVLPADAVVADASGYQKVLEAAFVAAEADDVLVTIGIRPDTPATGYGYLERGEAAGEAASRPVYRVRRFVEKPDLETARQYLDAGNFYWNAGMFVWSVPSLISALETHTPDLVRKVKEIGADLDAGTPLPTALAAHYPDFEKISVDYALMEKAKNVVCVESDFDWDDVGEWTALARHAEPDEAGNVIRGEAELKDSKNNIVVSQGGHLTAVLGVEDLIVVHSSDATLICHRSKAQDIKKLVKDVTEKRPNLA